MTYKPRKERVFDALPGTVPELAERIGMEPRHVTVALRQLEQEERAFIKYPKSPGVRRSAEWAQGTYPSEAHKEAARKKRQMMTTNPGSTTELADKTVERAREKPLRWFSLLEQ